MDLVADERAEGPGMKEDLRAEENGVVSAIVKTEYVTNTYRATTTKRLVDVIHRPSECVQLSARFSAFLELSLKSTQDDIKAKPALAWLPHTSSHATHASEPLLWRLRTPLLSTIEVEC